MMKAKEGKYVWLNGKFVDIKKALIPIKCQSVQYGFSGFEGIRFYKTKKGRAIFRLEDHMKRLEYTMKSLNMKFAFSLNEIRKAIIKTVQKNGFEEGYIRPWVGYTERKLGLDTNPTKVTIALFADYWPLYFLGKSLRVMISPFVRLAPESFSLHAKIAGHYVNSYLASQEAKSNGFDTAILLDRYGNVAEAPVANIFIVNEYNEIGTPGDECILPGITRDTIMKICKDYYTAEIDISIEDLWNAKEVFITGTAAEIMPIGSIDCFHARLNPSINEHVCWPTGSRTKIVNVKPGPITKKLQKLYSQVVHGEITEYEHWLTYI
ncbi:MAG: aminotransferase class IV [Candidatus Marinimicrobia bacterium]|nr:aminotransferase class IV [Candidatus Neomarinimicrobiota bacterium]